ncbi:MAG: LPXTG cell wall anchor domain-containing protein [Candidatus Limivicinus sp.]|nr:LPXTG cell wall anchor domain-containing protein [Candidatus Limivicinus sp.]
MKRTCKTIASLVMMLVLLLGIGAPAYADGIVSYQGGAEKFVFLPGSSYTDTDLFDGFKNVMPGDTLTQTVEVRNRFLGTGSVRIYLRAVAHDEQSNPLSANVAASGETVATMSDFLSQLYMEVWQGSECIFTGSPNELDGLKNNVLLANVPRGKSVELTVKLQVPAELGNEYAYRVGEVDWVFTAEELDPQGNPKTGDTSNLTLWIVVMVVCLAAIAVVAFLILKKKKAK